MPVANNVYFGSDHWLDGGSDPYNGDKSCSTTFPLACVGYSVDRACKTTTVGANQKYCACSNAQGSMSALELKFTDSIPGYWMSSAAHADELCRCFFGDLYRMARFHDAA